MSRVSFIILLLVMFGLMIRFAGEELRGNTVVETSVEGVGAGGDEPSAAQPASPSFNPAVPDELPDLNAGYVFIEARELLEEDFDDFAKGGGANAVGNPDDLEDVEYKGSIIIGELRRGLISFPERRRETRRPGGKGRRKKTNVPMMYRQLSQGSKFMGFTVELLEVDRIVFAREGERVEKFLFDPDTDRNITENVVRSKPTTPPPPNIMAVPAVKDQPVVNPSPPPAQRRSQRLLRRNPPLMVLPPSGAGIPSAK